MNPKPIPWKQAYPDAPASFTCALEKTLTNLEEIRPARRRIPLRAALVAAVLFSLAAGMATAAGSGTGASRTFCARTQPFPHRKPRKSLAPRAKHR